MTGQLPTEEHFNHLLAMVQQAMSATGVRLKVAPLAIESLQPKKGVTMCASPNGFNTLLGAKGGHIIIQSAKKDFFVSKEFHTLPVNRSCGVAGHQRKLQS